MADGFEGERSARADPLLQELLAAQPYQRVFVDDLDALDEAAISRRSLTPLVELTLLALRSLPHASPDEVAAAFHRWQHLLRAVDRAETPPLVPPLGGDAVDAIGWYALAATDVPSLVLAETFAKILERNDRSIMSTLERTFQKGRTQGLAEGQVQTLLLQLAHRFGPLHAAVEVRVRDAAPADLDRWIHRVLDAASIDEVFETELPR